MEKFNQDLDNEYNFENLSNQENLNSKINQNLSFRKYLSDYEAHKKLLRKKKKKSCSIKAFLLKKTKREIEKREEEQKKIRRKSLLRLEMLNKKQDRYRLAKRISKLLEVPKTIIYYNQTNSLNVKRPATSKGRTQKLCINGQNVVLKDLGIRTKRKNKRVKKRKIHTSCSYRFKDGSVFNQNKTRIRPYTSIPSIRSNQKKEKKFLERKLSSKPGQRTRRKQRFKKRRKDRKFFSGETDKEIDFPKPMTRVMNTLSQIEYSFHPRNMKRRSSFSKMQNCIKKKKWKTTISRLSPNNFF